MGIDGDLEAVKKVVRMHQRKNSDSEMLAQQVKNDYDP